MEVLAVAAHAENAEHVGVSGLGKGADFLRARAVAVRALDLGRAGGRGGFAGGLGRVHGCPFCPSPGLGLFPELGRAWVVFRGCLDIFFPHILNYLVVIIKSIFIVFLGQGEDL